MSFSRACLISLSAAAALAGQATAAAHRRHFEPRDAAVANESAPMASTVKPSGFVAEYNHTYCAANASPIYVEPVIAYYPHSARAVFDLVGDYFNISWINPEIVITHSGEDNTVGAVRNQSGDPFAAMEYLTHYFHEETADGFFYQQAARVGYPMTIGAPITTVPDYVELDSHLVVDLVPACGKKAAQFGFYLTFCMSKDDPVGAKQLSAALTRGSASALKHLWTTLDGGRNTPFNSTTSCAAVESYQSQGTAGN